MPANLPPPYFEAEKRYREAKTPGEKVDILEEMLTIMPKHKGTDKLRADLRRRIAKLKVESQQKKGTSRRDTAYSIEKEGAAQVVILGPPNSGKSSLVAALTNAAPEVADFPHTTWNPTPGMAPYENIQFQLVDTPPVTKDYVDLWMTDLVRRADIVVILLDLHSDILQAFEDTLYVLEQMRIFPQGSAVPEGLRKTPFIKKVMVVVNKVDDVKDEQDYETFLELAEVNLPCVGISTLTGYHLKGFLDAIYELSEVIRVYTKAPGKAPKLEAPFVLPKETTLGDLASKVHKDFAEKLKYAKIWGKSVFDGQMVQRDYVLQDGDVVEIHI